MALPTAADLALKAFSRAGLYETLTTSINGSGTLIVTATRTGRNAMTLNYPSAFAASTVQSPNVQEQHLQDIADATNRYIISTMPA